MALLITGAPLVGLATIAAITTAEWTRPPVPYKQAKKIYGVESHLKHVDATGQGQASDIHPEPAWQTVGEDNRMSAQPLSPTTKNILLINKSIKSQAKSRALSDDRLASTANSKAPEFQNIK